MIINGDCLFVMQGIKSHSIDMILCDLPYGITNNHWDSVIPLDKLWEHYERIIKPNGAIVLNAAQPFTSMLIMSNLKRFKYEWIWKKSNLTGHLNSKRQPLRNHESVVVFYNNQTTYHPQMTKGKPYTCITGRGSTNYGQQHPTKLVNEGVRYPRTIQEWSYDTKKVHPTQKPVDMLCYLINTYTNENEIVLDNCIGSGSTAIACLETHRKYIGIDISFEMCQLSIQRIREYEELHTIKHLPNSDEPIRSMVSESGW